MSFLKVDIVTIAAGIGEFTPGDFVDEIRMICLDGNFDILDTLGDTEGYTVIQNNEILFQYAMNLRKAVINFKGTNTHKIRILSKRTQ